MSGPGSRWRRLGLDAWPLGLALVLVLPLLVRPGHPLARDLVFVPHQPLTEASLGLGDGAPRAVPLDAVVALLTHLVDGGVVARVVLPLLLAAAGWGAHRLVGALGTPARLVAGGAAVWNPFVVERLALGQWALLLAYAALPWLLLLAARQRWAPATLWLALASLTPTGGLLGSAALLAGASRSGAVRARTVALCGVLQLPWVVPALLGAGTRPADPLGVTAFASRAEGPGGVLGALLGLGGIWDAGSVPATRESWWAPVTALVVVAVLVLGWRGLDEATAGLRAPLAGLAAAGFALALLVHVPGGAGLLRFLLETAPGAGLLRDGQKFVAPLALLAVASAAVAVQRMLAHLRPAAAWATVLLAVLAPVVLLPDATTRAWPTVTPVRYPDGFEQVERALQGEPGDLATLPWRAYRRFEWGRDLTASDPALRWYDRRVLVSDDLQVGRLLVRGESERGARLGRSLESGVPAIVALAAARVTWALVYLDDPGLGRLDLTGLEEVYADGDLALYRVPVDVGQVAGPSAWRRTVVLAADALAGVVVLGAVLALAGRVRGRSRGR